MADLLKVQEAANAAHRNFKVAMELNHNAHNDEFFKYLDGFLDNSVPRSEPIKQFAKRCVDGLIAFGRVFNGITQSIALILIERDLLVGGASVDAIDLILRDFSVFLDNTNARLKGAHHESLKAEGENQLELDKLTEDVEAFGYAVALVEQLGANLAQSRLENLAEFRTTFIEKKTYSEAFRTVSGEDIIDILREIVLAYIGVSTNLTALAGPIKKALDVWDKRRAPRAGHQTGDADILFELDALIGRDKELGEQVALALAEAKRQADTLRTRQMEIAKGRSETF